MRTDERDDTLVLAAWAGDKEAFAALIDRHRVVLVALCRRTLGDPLLAEDAAHEAMLQALLSLDRLRRPDRFGPWLCGIGLNVCRRWLREQTRDGWSWEALCGGRSIPEPCDLQPGPEALAESGELAERVRRAVEILPPGQRAAVLFFYLSGLTYAETAQLLGIEVSAVKTRLHKARKTLREQLWTVWKEEYMGTTVESQPVEMRIADVRRVPSEGEERSPRHVVVLEEVDGERLLLIWIGRPEGEAIAVQLEKVETPRPLTFTFMANLLQAAGARAQEVRITRLAEDVFYATVAVEGPSGTQTVDARPSDAMILALATGTPIRVEPAVLEAAAIRAGEEQKPPSEGVAGAREITALSEGAEGAKEIVAEVRLAYARRK